MVASWDQSAQLHAAFSLGLDYLYLPLYAVTIALACVWAAAGGLRPWRMAARLGFVLALAELARLAHDEPLFDVQTRLHQTQYNTRALLPQNHPCFVHSLH
jgi:hypothetical protein